MLADYRAAITTLDQPAIKKSLSSSGEATPYPWLRPRFPALEYPRASSPARLPATMLWSKAVALTPDGRLAVSASADNTLKEVCGTLRRYLHERPDLGMGKTMLDTILDPPNPFDSQVRLAPRRWFVLFMLISGALLGCLVYFNKLI